jgi:hypothetical protein
MGSRLRVMICGSGAIGAAITYFPSRCGARPIVIERYEVERRGIRQVERLSGADWCQGSPLDRWARRSFALHAQHSSELGDPWAYRRLTSYGGFAAEGDTARGRGGGHRGSGSRQDAALGASPYE